MIPFPTKPSLALYLSHYYYSINNKKDDNSEIEILIDIWKCPCIVTLYSSCLRADRKSIFMLLIFFQKELNIKISESVFFECYTFMHSKTYMLHRSGTIYSIPFFKMFILGDSTELPTVSHAVLLVTFQLLSPNSLISSIKNYFHINMISTP